MSRVYIAKLNVWFEIGGIGLKNPTQGKDIARFVLDEAIQRLKAHIEDEYNDSNVKVYVQEEEIITWRKI